MAPPMVIARTTWHSRDGHYVLPEVGDAGAQLAVLLGLYREGLRRPIHFFPKCAWTYVVKGGNLLPVRTKWHSWNAEYPGEDRDPAYRLALRGVDDPLDAEFIECATKVFEPLLKAIDDHRIK
jgi:exodeoxyribonuclease V gamma subunit